MLRTLPPPPVLLRKEAAFLLPSASSIRTKDVGPHKFGCLMAILPDAVRKSIVDWALENVPDFHLGRGGRESRSHLTIKYGFRDQGVEEELAALLTRHGPLTLTLGAASLFTSDNKDGHVLKLDVLGPQVHELNRLVSQSFNCEDKYPEYKPHVTVAYLDPAISVQYDKSAVPGRHQRVTINELEYTAADGTATTIPLSFLNGHLSKALKGYLDYGHDREGVAWILNESGNISTFADGDVFRHGITHRTSRTDSVGRYDPKTNTATIGALGAEHKVSFVRRVLQMEFPGANIIDYSKALSAYAEGTGGALVTPPRMKPKRQSLVFDPTGKKDIKKGTCKQGERSDFTGCTPASGEPGQPKPSTMDNGGGVGTRELTSTWSEFKNQLTPKDLDVIKYYAAGGGGELEMNSLLRGEPHQQTSEKWKERVEGRIRDMDEVMRKAPPIPSDMTVFRGLDRYAYVSTGKPGVSRRQEIMKEPVEGEAFDDPGFVSTSLKEEVAKDFANLDDPNLSKTSILLKIKLPKGTRGLYAQPIVGNKSKSEEFVLPRGARFQIDHVEKLPNGASIAEVTYVVSSGPGPTETPEQPTGPSIKPKRPAPGSQMSDEVKGKLKQIGMHGTFPPHEVPLDKITVADLSDPEAAKYQAVMTWEQTSKNGRTTIQRRYTKEFHDRNAAQKFERVKAIVPHMEALDSKLVDRMAKATTDKDRQAATIAALILETGLRPTDSSESIKFGHFGIASLQARHVKIKGDEIRLDFIGKEGVRNQTVVRGKANVDMIKKALAGKKGRDFLFDKADSYDAAGVLKDVAKEAGAPEDIKLKDLRTVKALQEAERVVKAFKGPPPPITGNAVKDARAIKKAILQMSAEVAKKLNNTPAQARDSYIHPEIFKQWEANLRKTA